MKYEKVVPILPALSSARDIRKIFHTKQFPMRIAPLLEEPQLGTEFKARERITQGEVEKMDAGMFLPTRSAEKALSIVLYVPIAQK